MEDTVRGGMGAAGEKSYLEGVVHDSKGALGGEGVADVNARHDVAHEPGRMEGDSDLEVDHAVAIHDAAEPHQPRRLA